MSENLKLNIMTQQTIIFKTAEGEEDLKERLILQAKKERRTLSGFIKNVLFDYLNQVEEEDKKEVNNG